MRQGGWGSKELLWLPGFTAEKSREVWSQGYLTSARILITLWPKLRGRENLEKTYLPLYVSLKCLLKTVRATSQAMQAQNTPKSLHLCCHPTAYLRPDHSSQYCRQVRDILPSPNTVTKTPTQLDSTHSAKAVLAYLYHLWLSSCPTRVVHRERAQVRRTRARHQFH